QTDPLDRLPFTTRAEIQQDQVDHPPYGTNLTYPLDRYNRLHQTSGSSSRVPLRWLDTPEAWDWWRRCWAILWRGAGLRAQDRIIVPFSFGPFVGWWGAYDSAVAMGNFTLPAGGMTTVARLYYLLDHKITFVCCTPTYALRMAEVSAEQGLDIKSSAVRGLIVAGEPGGNIPGTRSRIESVWGARVFDHGGLTEIGPWGFECVETPGGQHVIESEFIIEVIDPRTGDAVPEGRPGEMVLTNLGRPGSPLIRYRTGDQVVMIRRRCACGRWFAWLDGGILGRIDDMLVIRGNNVFPSAVEDIVRRFHEVAEFALRADHGATLARLEIDLEPLPGANVDGLAERVAGTIRDRLHFRPVVRLVEAGSLPRFEGKGRRFVRGPGGPTD
ncbi:MAG: phenylacetate--CoA ligase family protein, partial [Phycisphaerae bacterium]